MIRATSAVVLSFAGSLAMASGCATMRPPAEGANAPVISAEGVKVALIGQSCDQIKEPDWRNDDLVEVTVEVGVQNPTTSQLLVHRDQFRLTAPDGTAVPPASWNIAEPMTVAPGQGPTFNLRFMTRGSLACARPMNLEARSAVTAGDRPLTLAALRFVPSRAP